jgi:hypothetical protein
MVTVKRPQRVFSFSDHQKTRPNQPPPGDRLDEMFMQLADAIASTQAALAEIRRDDGKLNNATVSEHHLAPGLLQKLADEFKDRIGEYSIATISNAAIAKEAERQAQLYAADAEAALTVATQLVNGMQALRALIETKSNVNTSAYEITQMLTNEAENWATYSHAQADNAIKAKDEALAWAEYLAGPVVDAAKAPAYISGSPFPNGLYYQPVEGGVAGLWSAKWWALQAYNLVGAAGQFFLGPWPAPPLAGEQNPSSGQVAPDPIPPGSIYYDTSSGQIMVWNGTAWKQTAAFVSSVSQAFVYQATAGQQTFGGMDLNGQIPVVGTYQSIVCVNGVRLVPELDYTINTSSNELRIAAPVMLNSFVQWDLLVPQIAPAAHVNAWKIVELVPDGVLADFALQYMDASSTRVDAAVGSSAELALVLDGTPQEPDVDYTAAGASLHLAAPPPADASLWAVWYQPEANA